MAHDGSSSPPLGPSWARWLLLCLFGSLLLLLAAQIVSGQTESAPPDLQLKAHLKRADELLTTLEAGLAQRPEQVKALQKLLTDSLAELEQLKADSAKSVELSASLAAALRETQTSLDQLMTRYATLSEASGKYQSEMQGQAAALGRERDVWKWGAIGAGVIAVCAIIIAAVK
jgi:uncharacterized phage infection (PIP) family protein YhgE